MYPLSPARWARPSSSTKLRNAIGVTVIFAKNRARFVRHCSLSPLRCPLPICSHWYGWWEQLREHIGPQPSNQMKQYSTPATQITLALCCTRTWNLASASRRPFCERRDQSPWKELSLGSLRIFMLEISASLSPLFDVAPILPLFSAYPFSVHKYFDNKYSVRSRSPIETFIFSSYFQHYDGRTFPRCELFASCYKQ